jgi:hypothetical protein
VTYKTKHEIRILHLSRLTEKFSFVKNIAEDVREFLGQIHNSFEAYIKKAPLRYKLIMMVSVFLAL